MGHKKKLAIKDRTRADDEKGINFRQFFLAAYCLHGDPIGRTWNVVLNRTGPDPVVLSPLERVLGLIQEWVLSDSYRETESTNDLVAELTRLNESITAGDVRIIEDVMQEFGHALELIAPAVWESEQRAMASKLGLEFPSLR